MHRPQRIILAITGATGMIYVSSLLRILEQAAVAVHAIISDAGETVLKIEAGIRPAELPGIENWFSQNDFTAPMASGSARYDAMVILPCTMGTLGAVAGGYCANLIHRAADVTLKERRPLILATRETPLNRTHLANMLKVHDAGGTIFPPTPSFYHRPGSIEEMALQYAARLCDMLNVDSDLLKRWGE